MTEYINYEDDYENSTSTPKPTDVMFLGHYKGVNIHSFARDLLLFGSSRVVEICDAYEMSAELFQEIIELPAFKKEMRELRALIEMSPNALIQLKARTIVERGLEEMQRIVFESPRDADRIKAFDMLVKVSGVMGGGDKAEENSGKPQASGLVLNVQLGPKGIIPPLPENRRNGTHLQQLTKVIDVVE